MQNNRGHQLFGDTVNTLGCGNRPDCLRCMREKLKAECVVVFAKHLTGWELVSFQGDMPQDAAEAEFRGMILENLPEVLYAFPHGCFLTTDADIVERLPKMSVLLGKSIIASRFKLDNYEGLRLAWRDQALPFSAADLANIQCRGECPGGCEPCLATGSF